MRKPSGKSASANVPTCLLITWPSNNSVPVFRTSTRTPHSSTETPSEASVGLTGAAMPARLTPLLQAQRLSLLPRSVEQQRLRRSGEPAFIALDHADEKVDAR